VDFAADWIEAEVAGPSLVLSALPRFALDPKRFEVRRARSLEEEAPAVAAQYDLLVTDVTRDADALAGFRVLARFPSEEGLPERAVTVLGPPEGVPALVEVASARVDRGAGSIRLVFDPPARVFRVEVDSGAADWPREIELSVRRSRAHDWERTAAASLRPTERDRRRDGAPEGQIYVLGAGAIEGLRLASAQPGNWTEARLQVHALSDEAPALQASDVSGRPGPDRRRRRRR
jgi:hypothetical protein